MAMLNVRSTQDHQEMQKKQIPFVFRMLSPIMLNLQMLSVKENSFHLLVARRTELNSTAIIRIHALKIR